MWYVHRNGETTGPFDTATLVRLLADGSLSPADYWWHDEAQAWVALSEHAAVSQDLSPAAHGSASAATSTPGSATLPQPVSGPLAAESFHECWRSLQTLIPDVPRIDHPFACDGCGTVQGLPSLRYQNQTYLCADCVRTGVVKKEVNIVATRNPFSTLLLRHAWVWALILILVPFLGFKMLANMLDPYKSYPLYYTDLKQTIQILEGIQEVKDQSWAHAIRQTLLRTADAASGRALPQASDADRDIAYLARLLTLEALGQDTVAVALIRSESRVHPPGNDEERRRAFRWLEVRILERTGEWDLIQPRLRDLMPTRREPGMVPMIMNPGANSPLMSGQKAYNIELRASLYKLIEVDGEKIDELTRGATSESRYGMEDAVSPTNQSEQIAWSQQEFNRLKQEAVTLATEGDALRSSNGTSPQKNAGLEEARLSAAIDAIVKLMGTRVQVQSQRIEREERSSRADLNLQVPRLGDAITLIEKLTGSEFPFTCVLARLNAHHYQNGREDRWRVQVFLVLPAPSNATGTMRARLDAEFAAPLDTDAARVQARVQTARMLVTSLRTEVAELKQAVRQQVEPAFGPVPQLLKDLQAAAPGGLTEISLDPGNMTIAGEGSTSSSLESVKAKLAPRVSEHRLTEDARMQNDTYQGKTIVRWRVSYRAPSR